MFQVQASQGLIFGGANEWRVFLHYEFGGLIFGGAYTLRGLFSDFYDIIQRCRDSNSKQVFDYNVKK